METKCVHYKEFEIELKNLLEDYSEKYTKRYEDERTSITELRVGFNKRLSNLAYYISRNCSCNNIISMETIDLPQLGFFEFTTMMQSGQFAYTITRRNCIFKETIAHHQIATIKTSYSNDPNVHRDLPKPSTPQPTWNEWREFLYYLYSKYPNYLIHGPSLSDELNKRKIPLDLYKKEFMEYFGYATPTPKE